jgi:tetratricopeptide (TPR) repeat protein
LTIPTAPWGHLATTDTLSDTANPPAKIRAAGRLVAEEENSQPALPELVNVLRHHWLGHRSQLAKSPPSAMVLPWAAGTLSIGTEGEQRSSATQGEPAMRWVRVCAAFVILAAIVPAGAAHAEPPPAAARQIAELERAIALHETAARERKTGKSEDMTYLLSLARLASLYVETDQIQASWPLSEKMLAGAEKLFGRDHPSTVAQIEALAATYGLQGRYSEAEALRKRAVAINERASGPDSLATATSLQGLANLFRLQDRRDEGLVFAERALSIANRRLPPGDTQRAMFVSQVADLHMSSKRFDVALPLLKDALAMLEKLPGGDTALVGMQKIQYLQSIGLAYHGMGRAEEAKPYIDRALATSERVLGPGHTATAAMLKITTKAQLRPLRHNCKGASCCQLPWQQSLSLRAANSVSNAHSIITQSSIISAHQRFQRLLSND